MGHTEHPLGDGKILPIQIGPGRHSFEVRVLITPTRRIAVEKVDGERFLRWGNKGTDYDENHKTEIL